MKTRPPRPRLPYANVTGAAVVARIGAGALAVLAALLVGEWAVRILDHPGKGAGIRLEQFSSVLEDGHRVRFREAFVSDPELFWRLARDVELPEDAFPLRGRVSSSQGLREDHVVAEGEHAGEVRILFLGDSCTFGYGLLPEETFVELTERELRRRFPASGFECINAGVPGYTAYQGLRYLTTEGFAYAPDVVVVAFGWNESARWDGVSDASHHAALRKRSAPAVLRGSRLAELLWAAARPRPSIHQGDEGDEAKREGEERPRLTPAEYRAVLADIRRACAQRGVACLILVGAGRFNLSTDEPRLTPYQEVGLEVGRAIAAEGAGGGLVDAVGVLRAREPGLPLDGLFLDGLHPTRAANEVLAGALGDAIGSWLERRLPPD